MKRYRWPAFLAVAVFLLAACGGDDDDEAGGSSFEGVTVNLVTFTGPQIAEPLQRRAPAFEKRRFIAVTG